jgi:hypothetical protein
MQKGTQPPNPIYDSESGSVVVHDAGSKDAPGNPLERPFEDPISHQDGRPTPKDTLSPNVDILGMYTQNDDCAVSPRSRKRSAKTASLPDSIPPDNDDEPMTRRKLMITEADLKVGRDDEFLPESIPLPNQVFTNGLGSAELVDSLPDYETPVLSPETSPSKSDKNNAGSPLEKGTLNANRLTKENLSMRDNRSESLRVCNGSLVDTGDTGDTDAHEEDPPLSFETNGSTRDFTAINLSWVLPQPPAPAQFNRQHEHEPKLVLEDGIVYFRTPPGACPMKYQVCVTFDVILRKGKSSDWWELDLRGLPQLASPESGYLYFRTTPGQGMEYGTAPFKRNTVVENCLMAQFTAGRSLVIPLRKCSAEHYGFVHDYKINSVLHLEIFEETPGYAIEYTAICSIDLVNHNFWSEQCSFRLYVHGGPEGTFSGHFTESKLPTNASTPPIYNLILNPASSSRIGVSQIEMTCAPATLNLFAVQWEVKVPRTTGLTMPRIKNTGNDEVERTLRSNFALVDSESYALARPLRPERPERPDQPDQPDQPAQPEQQKKSAKKIPEKSSEKPEKPKKARHILRGLGQTTWALVKFLFHGFCFLASLHTLYLSYLLVSHGCPVFPSSFCRNESPGNYARVNTTDNYNLTLTE